MVFVRARDLRLVYEIRNSQILDRRKARVRTAGATIAERGNRRFITALNGVSFDLAPGDRVGLTGGNGAGKTTLLKMLYGIYDPTGGSLAIEGRVDALFNINLGFRPDATGRRNIVLRGLINGWSSAKIAAHMHQIIEFSGLGEFIDMPLKSYSQGMAARLAFSVATALDPEILLMDEWIGAGDAAFQKRAAERMDRLASKAGIIVLASHNEDLIQRVCNKRLVLDRGQLVSFG